VSDFRPRDVAAGGQGAPLVPYVDWLLLRDEHRNRAAVNIGGIANVTLLPAKCSTAQVAAFDTGPGNMVLDQLASHFSGGRARCDENGAMAAQGVVCQPLVSKLLEDEFYRRKPPKSAGREQYGDTFIADLLAADLAPADTMATATQLTASTIAQGIREFGGARDYDLIVSGGGVHNATLMKMLRAELPEKTHLGTSLDYGIDPDFKEALAFAVLARETWLHRPGNLPSATGARHAVVLGKISL